MQLNFIFEFGNLFITRYLRLAHTSFVTSSPVFPAVRVLLATSRVVVFCILFVTRSLTLSGSTPDRTCRGCGPETKDPK